MSRIYILLPLVLLITFPAIAQSAADTIRQIMKDQEECWNRGDLECFMIGYWESDSLMFISKDKIHYGFQNTLKRYQSTYSNREAMGLLTFEFMSMEQLSKTSFYVIGNYHLQRTVGDLQGHFTLLWRKIAGEWVIVADHSS